MIKDSFFDTNIIFNYSNYTDESKIIIKKCYFYILNKKPTVKLNLQEN